MAASGDAYVEEQVPQEALQRPSTLFDAEPVGVPDQVQNEGKLPRFGAETLRNRRLDV